MAKTSSQKEEKRVSNKFLNKLAESKKNCPACEKQKILKRILNKLGRK